MPVLTPKMILIILAVLAAVGMCSAIALRIHRAGQNAEQLKTLQRIADKARDNRARDVRNDDAVAEYGDAYGRSDTKIIEGQTVYLDRVIAAGPTVEPCANPAPVMSDVNASRDDGELSQ